jgi:hypothetical protein
MSGAKMNLRELKKHVGALGTRQLVRLDEWIHELLKGSGTGGETGRRRKVRTTYRSEMVRCGKK